MLPMCLSNVILDVLQELVLHNIMPIFTFMGASILRQDSLYSFQIITKTIDTIIPPLIKVYTVGREDRGGGGGGGKREGRLREGEKGGKEREERGWEGKRGGEERGK